jgi:hypothetical protein
VIRSLRARHRGIFVLLLLTLPAAFATALLGRRALTPEAPPTLSTTLPEVWRELQWPRFDAVLGLRYDPTRTLALRLQSWKEPAAPVLLLYWSPSEPTDDSLPPAARLLGSAASAPREFTLEAAAPRGWLVLYSLGHSEVLGSLPVDVGQER